MALKRERGRDAGSINVACSPYTRLCAAPCGVLAGPEPARAARFRAQGSPLLSAAHRHALYILRAHGEYAIISAHLRE